MQEDRVAIQTITEFLSKVEVFDSVVSNPLFRGQSRRGNLLPSIARENPSVDSTESEKIILKQLRLQSASLLAPPASDLGLLIQAQHFGMRTRLLDWTSNPLVALWFACNSTGVREDAFVYALEADELLAEELPEDPFKPGRTRVVQPPMNNARIVAQHGWFTLHNYSSRAQRFVPLEENPQTSDKLHEFLIEGETKEHLLSALDRIGISARTLFPDFGGLCQHLNWKYRDHHLPAL
jgi:hypothetical protein